MIVPLFLGLALSSAPTPVASALHPSSPRIQDETEKRIAECGEDVDKLLELAQALKDESNRDGARKAYRRVLELDPNNEKAHKGLRHHWYDGQWFESYAKLAKYKREEAKRMKEEHGLVRYEDEWVPETDLPFLRMGWVKEGDQWVNPRLKKKQEKIAELKEAGYQLRKDDMTWIAPDEMDKWKALLWKCGDEWLTTEEANQYHSKLGQWWKLGGEHFEIWSTCEWNTANRARWHADLLYPELVKIFGKEPQETPIVIVLNSLEQYNTFAGGSQEAQILPAESEGFSSLHHAFFADVFFDVSELPPIYVGAGVAYWDSQGNASAWGPHSVRHATAQSFCEKIDPSWLAISEMLASQGGGGGPDLSKFWKEKKIPRWLRYGAASYVERYVDDQVQGLGRAGTTVRDWAFQELGKKGMRPLKDIFEFGLTLDDIPGSSALIHEAGAVVAYLMQKAPEDVREAHAAFREALRQGQDTAPAVEKLQAALQKHEKELRKFVGV